MLSSKVAGLAFQRAVQVGDPGLEDLRVRTVMTTWIWNRVESKEKGGTRLRP